MLKRTMDCSWSDYLSALFADGVKMVLSKFQLYGLANTGLWACAIASQATIINFSTVPGYFLQDLNSTNATTFDFVSRLLSLV